MCPERPPKAPEPPFRPAFRRTGNTVYKNKEFCDKMSQSVQYFTYFCVYVRKDVLIR